MLLCNNAALIDTASWRGLTLLSLPFLRNSAAKVTLFLLIHKCLPVFLILSILPLCFSHDVGL